MSAISLVSAGSPVHSRGGDTSSPSPVYFLGITSPALKAGLDTSIAMLRACLVSNRVGLGGAKFASPTRRTAPCGLLIQGNLLSFRSVSTKESYRDRPFAYARTPKRVNPHPYQTGS